MCIVSWPTAGMLSSARHLVWPQSPRVYTSLSLILFYFLLVPNKLPNFRETTIYFLLFSKFKKILMFSKSIFKYHRLQIYRVFLFFFKGRKTWDLLPMIMNECFYQDDNTADNTRRPQGLIADQTHGFNSSYFMISKLYIP